MERQGTTLGKLIALGRVLFGLGCMTAPRKLLGPAAAVADGPMIWMVRAFGVRDVVLGAGTFQALNSSSPDAVTWVKVSAAADTLDVANAVIFRKELDRAGIAATLGLAVPATIGGWLAARWLEQG